MASRLHGDWGRLRRITRINKPFLNEALKAELIEIGNEILEKIVSNVVNQSLGLEPHSPNYRHNKDGTILYLRGNWVNQLRVVDVIMQQNGLVVFIGGSKDDSYQTYWGESVPMDVFTDWIENGTINQPPRPVFRLTWEEIMPEYRDKIIKLLESEIMKAMR